MLRRGRKLPNLGFGGSPADDFDTDDVRGTV